ncbi:hypothetical protein CL620_02175 [archaeon]|nr:hypothetical protein [archaeon]
MKRAVLGLTLVGLMGCTLDIEIPQKQQEDTSTEVRDSYISWVNNLPYRFSGHEAYVESSAGKSCKGRY